MRRREFIAGLGAVALPLVARAQQAILQAAYRTRTRLLVSGWVGAELCGWPPTLA
jgi:hypothetical protein